ncbi:MAG: spherulation-specific family 4 protein [Thermoproteus sp.]|nr:spherulation-specific family 4 protein [Thermoproteus sp.]MDT7881773.1 spherulation-specific family 4 protein [Thermoproteus sp.]
MRGLWVVLVAAALATVAALTAVVAAQRALVYIVPLYSYPCCGYEQEWGKLLNLHTDKEVWVVVNVDDGPGSSVDSTYVSVISGLKQRGFKVLGYIYSSYGRRSLETVYSEMDRWIRFYNVDGFFIDEVSTSLETYSYYSSIYSRAKSLGKYVVLNPGTNTDSRFFNIADKIVVFESPLEEYVNFSYLDYSSAAPDRVCTIVLNTPPDKVDYVVQKAVANGSRCVYVHDRADKWQTGDSAYFYLSPYLSWLSLPFLLIQICVDEQVGRGRRGA